MYEHSPKPYFRHIPTRGRSKWKLWLIGGIAIVCLLAIITASLSLWPHQAMSNYLGLDGETVAQVQFSTTRIPHLILVNVILLDKDHHSTRNINCYIMQGEKLMFQGDILTFAPWLNSIGLHGGFKLIRLTGCYNDAKFKEKLALSNLNGGQDNFFRMVQGQAWYSWLVEAHYSKPIFLLANLPIGQKSKSYNMSTSQKEPNVVPSK